jgi:hypothetical protein
METELNSMTITELKAVAYDQINIIEKAQRLLIEINRKIEEKK